MEAFIFNIMAFLYCAVFAFWHIVIWTLIVAVRAKSLRKAIEFTRHEFDLKWFWYSGIFWIVGTTLLML